MERKVYADFVKAEVENILGSDYKVTVNEVTKNNNIKMTAIMITRNGNEIAPAIYIDEMQDNGLASKEAAKEVVKIYEANKVNRTDVIDNITELFNNKEKLLAVVKPKLVNANQDEDLISYPFMDMKVVFYIEVDGFNPEGGKATVTLRKGQTEAEPMELYKAAIGNMEEPIIMSMSDFIPFVPTECPMEIIVNESRVFGATGILKTEVLKELAERFDDDVIILPSSIHEVICVPLSEMEGNPMVQMVREINRSDVLDPKEVLSDNVYIYNKTTNVIEMRWED